MDKVATLIDKISNITSIDAKLEINETTVWFSKYPNIVIHKLYFSGGNLYNVWLSYRGEPCAWVYLENGEVQFVSTVFEDDDVESCLSKLLHVCKQMREIKYIAPIEKRAKLRECQKGVTDGREKTMDWSGKAVNRTTRAEGRMFCQCLVQ